MQKSRAGCSRGFHNGINIPLLLEIPPCVCAFCQICLRLGVCHHLKINKYSQIFPFSCHFQLMSSQLAAEILVSNSQGHDLVLSTIKFHPISSVPALHVIQLPAAQLFLLHSQCLPALCHQQMPSAPSYLLFQGLSEKYCARAKKAHTGQAVVLGSGR